MHFMFITTQHIAQTRPILPARRRAWMPSSMRTCAHANTPNTPVVPPHPSILTPSHHSAQKLAEGNQLKLTREYLELMKYQSIANNTKIYFGPDIPSVFTPAMLDTVPSKP